jgi:hypothetical protein
MLQFILQQDQMKAMRQQQERENAVKEFHTLREIVGAYKADPTVGDALFEYWGNSQFGKAMKPQLDVFRKSLKDGDEAKINLFQGALDKMGHGVASGNMSVRDAYGMFKDPVAAFQFIKQVGIDQQSKAILGQVEPTTIAGSTTAYPAIDQGGSEVVPTHGDEAAAFTPRQASPITIERPPMDAGEAQGLTERHIDSWRQKAMALETIGNEKAASGAWKSVKLLEDRLTRMGDTQTETITGDDGKNYRVMYNKRTGESMRVLGSAGKDTQVIQGTDEAGNPVQNLVNKNTGDVIATMPASRAGNTLAERTAVTRVPSGSRADIQNEALRIETGLREAAGYATAKGLAAAKREEPVGTTAATLINPKTMQSPPTTMTRDEAIKAGYLEVPEKERASLADLEQTKAILSTIKIFADKLITAESPLERTSQALKLKAGAVSGTDPAAATYQAQRQSFLGIISRTLGGERGVLTDRDVARIDSALPSFSDSKTTKNLKIGLLNNLLKTATEAKMALITGQPIQTGAVERIQALLDAAEKVSAKDGKGGGDKAGDVDAARKRLGLE